MAQRTFPESGQDGRSVLGMLSVQVERDPKTGATVIRSVAPLSSPSGATTTVFDDGRKSIHAVGGSGNQPSSEELGQILSIVDGVGMRVLLDEVTVTPEEVKMKNEDAHKAPKGKLLSVFSRQNEEETPQDTSRSYEFDLKTQECSGNKEVDRSNTFDLKTQECSGNKEVDGSNTFDLKTQECSGNKEVDRSNTFDLKTQECSGNKEVDRSNTFDLKTQECSGNKEVDGSNTFDLKTQECSGNKEVDRSNTFDLKTQECSGNKEVDRSNTFDLKTQECSGNKEVDRSNMAVRDIPGEVDNVEDLNLEEGPVTLVFMGYSDQSQEEDEGPITVERVMINEEGEETVLGPQTPQKESKEFQDIPLDGNGVKVQGEEADEGLHDSSSPSIAEGGGTPKRKSCQCCSVM
ncbi:hypothetical protein OYC64_006570 [Pagothenia borchgrevinki]|uniref:Uncharacterized protein n=1 Tax=Pagothenia borchgrevinki TaxID=8213 RepID=A0ABD2GJZ9_PAGBO